jgi:hypothetical protein
MIEVSKSNTAGLLAVLAGMLIFKATTFIQPVEDLIKQYPWVVIILALILFFNREKIASKIGGNKNGR